MRANKTAAGKVPKILIDRRKPGPDNIQNRSWGRWGKQWGSNPLGIAYLKKPEPMKLSEFYASEESAVSAKEYEMHKLLEQKILYLLKARSVRPYGFTIYRGISKEFYVRLKSISSDKSVYIRVDKPQIKKAIAFLFK